MSRILLSVDIDVAPSSWSSRHAAQFVASYYGNRATPGLIVILSAETAETEASLALLHGALELAAYPVAEVPRALLIDLATRRWHTFPASIRGSIRQWTLKSLAATPDSSLLGFWRQLAKEPDPSYRQYVPAALACTLGDGAKQELVKLTQDSGGAVARVAGFYLDQLARGDEEGLLCMGGLATRAAAPTYGLALAPELLNTATRRVGHLP